jgi:general secretion pathway protein K
MASAGVHAGIAMMIRDKYDSQIDSIQEDWANPEKISELLESIQFEKGTLELAISDELARIQVNALVQFPEGRHFNESQKTMWDRFSRLLLSQADKEEFADKDQLKDIEATAIINSVKDWLDSGDDDLITGLDGAESDYYKGLNPPYSCKNGPFSHLTELMLVKGITPQLYYGFGDIPGLSQFMTVHGSIRSNRIVENRAYSFPGKININTAELPVIIAIVPSEKMDYAQDIYDYRNEQSDGVYIHDLTSPTWYKNAPGGTEINIDPNLITVSSDIFRIQSTATLNDLRMTVSAVIQREKHPDTAKWICRVLTWETH